VQLKSVVSKFIKKEKNQPGRYFFFEGREIQGIAVFCVKQSCESILESMVSMDEYHFDGTRNMGEVT